MIVILHNIRSMHNVGSIFRTSDGSGCVEKIYLCGITPAPIDRFGRKRPQITKVSLGAEDYVPWEKIGYESYDDDTWENTTSRQTINTIDRLKNDGFVIVAVEQHPKSIDYFEYKPNQSESAKTAIILGHEPTGIPDTILEHCDIILEIPMNGLKNSLNVSVACGIILYKFAENK